MGRALLWGLAALFAGGCGQSVTIMHIHDDRLPTESRRWIADAEDAVAVAVALRDRMEERLEDVEKWRDTLYRRVQWTGGGGQAKPVLDQLVAARIQFAKMHLAKAVLELELAEAKQEKINAETAMRHDLAVYDLKPIRQKVDGIRAEVKAMAVALVDQRQALEKLTSQWWQAYAGYVKSSGDQTVMWVEPPAQ